LAVSLFFEHTGEDIKRDELFGNPEQLNYPEIPDSSKRGEKGTF
jgi:hypothetical protein